MGANRLFRRPEQWPKRGRPCRRPPSSERQLRVDSGGSIVVTRTAAIWRKPGVQSGQGEPRGGCLGLSLQPRYPGWEGRRHVLRRRRASQPSENNALQNGFVDAERPGDLEGG